MAVAFLGPVNGLAQRCGWRRCLDWTAKARRFTPQRATNCDSFVTRLTHGGRRSKLQAMSKPLILIVDDDAELSAMLVELLSREGWAVHTVLTAGDGERALARWQPEAVLLDVMLPDANGFDVCRRWRSAHPGLGIVMLTARGDPMDRVLGLEIGADDYLPKPFEPRELVARVRALLRRQTPGRADATQLRFDSLSINLLKREVLAGACAVPLTSIEYKLLIAMARTPGTPQTREHLTQAVQSGSYKPLDRTVDVQVARLRRKLAEAAPGKEWIDTVRGEGYVFVPRG
jgi:two-component system phosphate regulon response regulator OmpR